MSNQYNPQYIKHPIYQRLMSPGPKRILALDGGGIRGALTVGYLEKIEDLLRMRYDDPDYRLWQYYDMIGGTSTGAIIATLLAEGASVDEIKRIYFSLGQKIFSEKKFPRLKGPLAYLRYLYPATYNEVPLEEELDKHLTNKMLGTEELRTGLCIVARRADNYGTYGFNNHPASKYYEENKGVYLKDLIRASSAAPTYFRPKVLELGDDDVGVFVDGGISSANNPALLLFMITTMEEHGFNWHLGADELLITSIGTGSYMPKQNKDSLLDRISILWAPELPNLFMADANSLNQTLLEYLANPRLSKHINAPTVQAKSPDEQTAFSQGAFTYRRYNVKLKKNSLREINIFKSEKELKSLREMDIGENAQDLYDIGVQAAKHNVKASDFPEVFDLTKEYLECNTLEYKDLEEKFQAIFKEKGIAFKKYKHVFARKAKLDEQVVSLTDNLVETINTAKLGDYILTNQTTDEEEYIVKAKVFEERYEVLRHRPDGSFECLPKGEVLAIELTTELLYQMNLDNHFLFKAPWNEVQYARSGDYLLCNADYKDIYRISRAMFFETYIKK